MNYIKWKIAKSKYVDLVVLTDIEKVILTEG